MTKKKGNIYDRVYKEILGVRAPDILKARDLVDISSIEEVSFDLQRTLERKPDFLARCTDGSGRFFILHIEYQTHTDAEMVFRMLEYYALIARKYTLPVKQFVFYVGKKKYPLSETVHQSFDWKYQYLVWDITKYKYSTLLASDYPEEVLLAIHSNFAGEAPEEIVQKIINRLKALSPDKRTLKKYVIHLTTISNLQNLEKEVIKISKKMDIIDQKDFPSYKEGRKEGIREGIREGIKEGKLEAMKEFALILLKDGYTPEQVAQRLSLPLKEIRELQRNTK